VRTDSGIFRLNVQTSVDKSYLKKKIFPDSTVSLSELFLLVAKNLTRDAPDTVFAGYPAGRISG
jgi:hypothetical protein